MKKRSLIILISILCCSNLLFGQLHFQEHIQQNKIASTSPKKVFLVDFWATWCGPCLHLWKQLEIFQEHFADELYILSVSQEKKSDVIPFLQKNRSNLAIALDPSGVLLNELGGRFLPFGAVYDASGRLLWKGNPSDLSFKQLSSIINRTKKRISPDDFFSFDENSSNHQIAKNSKEKVDIKAGSFKLISHNSPYEGKEAVVQREEGYIAITGRVSQLLAFLLKCSESEIKLEKAADVHKTLLLNPSDAQKVVENIFEALIIEENLTYEKKIEIAEILNFSIKSNQDFWNQHQIKWEGSTQVFMRENGQLLADNCSVLLFLYKLAASQNKAFVLETTIDSEKTLYDWNIHYKYNDLMDASLADFGIELQKLETIVPVYHIRYK